MKNDCEINTFFKKKKKLDSETLKLVLTQNIQK